MSAPEPAPTTTHVVLLPVKPPGRGKSRLRELPDDLRSSLAAAFALDTAEAALATPSVRAVLAVTDDHAFAGELAAAGCSVIPDGVSGDLNATLVQAAAEAARRWPGARPVALTADLPALRPEELERVLAVLPDSPAFVPDAAGTGTSLYSAPRDRFAPEFGRDSAARHRDAGAVELAAGPSVRRDVDDVADLGAATVLGLGRRSALLMGR